MIYDPGRHIHSPSIQLPPFGSIVEVCHDLKGFLYQRDNSENNQLFLLLIFHDKNDVDVKRFLMKHIPNQAHLFALYLIFPNGLQFHERWIDTETMPKLVWCRSFTTHLIPDILDVCQLACSRTITFYQQRQIQAEDAIERDTIDSAESIPILCLQKIKEFSSFLASYLTGYNESDN